MRESLFIIFSKYLLKIIVLLILTGMGIFFTSQIPRMMGSFIDSLQFNKLTDVRIIKFGYTFLLSTFILAITNYNESIQRTYLSNSITIELYHDIIKKIEKLPFVNTKNTEASEENNIVTTDCNEIISLLINLLTNFPVRLFLIMYLVVFIFKANIMFGVLVLIICITNVLFSNYIGKRVTKLNNIYRTSQSKFVSFSTERLRNKKFIKINAISDWYEQRSMENFDIFLRTTISYSKTAYIFSNFSFYINQFATLFLLTISGFLINKNLMSIGNFITLNSYFLLVNSQIGYFVSLLKQVFDSKASYLRLSRYFNDKPFRDGDIIIDEIKSISVKGLNLLFGKASKIDVKFNISNIYCIVGENGIGKSTFIDTLIGLFPNHGGDIFYNEIHLDKLNSAYIRENKISYMEQTPTIIFENFDDNLSIGYEKNNLNVFRNRIKDSLFLNSIAEDLNGLNCKNFSSGEKIKLGILMSLVKERNILIYDEPTANLDDASVSLFMNELLKIKENKIIILVSHDSRIINYVDAVVRFNGFINDSNNID